LAKNSSLLTILYREIVYGGHLLALGTSSMSASASLIMGLKPTLDLLIMAYLFSFSAYSINRLSDVDADILSHPDRTFYIKERIKLYRIAVPLFLFIGYFLAFMRSLLFFISLLLPFIFSILYSYGTSVYTQKGKRLKNMLLVKNITISLGWSLIPFLVSIYYSVLMYQALFFSLFIFLRMIVNTVYFDIRDVQADTEFNVRTIPSVYGISKAIQVISIFDIASAIYIFLSVFFRLLPLGVYAFLLFPAYSFIYRAFGNRLGRDVSRDLIADGEYILWGPIALIVKPWL
jgi:4-hydroxybenzoate polyprenyltransferase